MVTHARTGLSMTLAAAGLLAAAPHAASAADTDPVSFTCSASALSGQLLGQNLPVSQIAAGPCTTRTAPGVTLPAPLTAGVLAAATQKTDTSALAGTGLANLDLGTGLNIPLPLDEVLASVPAITVPLPTGGLLGLPSSISVDIKQAVAAALPNGALPSSLLRLGAVNALAGAACQPDGTLQTAAQSRVAGLSVLGIAVDTGQSIDTSLPLIDAQNLSLAGLDLTKVVITTPGIDLGIPAVQALVQNAISGVLAGLPPIAIPAQVAQVKLTLAETVKDATSATASGARLAVTLAGTPLVDLSIGSASVRATSACPPPATPTPAALQCTDRRIVLEDVLLRGSRVALRGFTNPSYAGQTVRVRLLADGKVAATAKVRKDGSFTATAAAPAGRLRATDRARYQAEIRGYKSLNLKLARRLQFVGGQTKSGKVTLSAKVTRPVPGQRVEIRQRLTCKKFVVVARTTVRKDGTVRVTVPAPKTGTEAVYRMKTQVRFSEQGSRKLHNTFTLPRTVKLR